ncbi:FAD/NAD(P)-binding protein [Negadavirga shengliensis]|uniref:FAD/NAD(P)-binding protein n=1 Tax=Negadavirga shengliensis TaxID=1389218 RepID=A0ABV9SWQ1_9BACT
MNIWQSSDLLSYDEICKEDFPIVEKEEYRVPSGSFKIAIIGAGPKGLYGLVALVNALRATPLHGPVEIHWYNETLHFATGQNYRIDQPDYLLINYAIGNISIWDDGGDFSEKLSLSDWLRTNVSDGTKVNEGDYASRALVGCYLKSCAHSILSNLPAEVTVKCIVGEVTDLIPAQNRKKFSLHVPGKYFIHDVEYDHVLLATGHVYRFAGEVPGNMRAFAHQSKIATYISPVYPVSEHLAHIKNTDKVCVKGMGLTFIDVVLALTEGRGGRFYAEGSQMRYEPSGKEPLSIYAFSEYGVPMLPQIASSASKSNLFFINEDWVEDLIEEKGKGNIDFEGDILPVLEREYMVRYYKSHMDKAGFHHAGSDGIWISDLDKIINRFHQKHPEVSKFDLDSILTPFHNLENIEACEYHCLVKTYLAEALHEIKEEGAKSLTISLAAVWKAALPCISRIYELGGFTGRSQQKFESEYLDKFNRISFGPPPVNIEKLVALTDSGHLFFRLGADTEVATNAATGKYRIYSHQTKYLREAKVLIDTGIARPDGGMGAPLFSQNLTKRKAGSLLTKNFVPSPIKLDIKGNIIDSRGLDTDGVALMGTRAEGIILDNDCLSPRGNDFIRGWVQDILSKARGNKYKQKQKIGA